MQNTASDYRMIWDRQSYRNIAYLLLSLPLGLCYFAVLVAGVTLVSTTFMIWIGIPILVLLLHICWQLAMFERRRAIDWLGVEIPPVSMEAPASIFRWSSLTARLSNRMTWKTLAYLLLKFPLGACFFTITIVSLALSSGVTIIGLVLEGISAPFFLLIATIQHAPEPRQRLRQYLLFALAGFGLNILTFRLLNGLAFLEGRLARSLLGMSDMDARLQAARAQAEQERLRAEQAEQRRRELVVNVSHELRAPVASISGHLESLLLTIEDGREALLPEQLHNYLSVAYQEARRLGMLVDDLLSLARMEAHELSLNMQDVNTSEVIEEVYQALMPLASRERQVTLVRGAQPGLPSARADRQRLIQVLTNLVRNAITSTPAGGIVSISLERADAQHLALIVEDNGVGIAADELARIFERFYRSDASRSRASGGFGLGLAIVRDLVTAMGGSISVESTPGQGSRFCVLLCASETRAM